MGACLNAEAWAPDPEILASYSGERHKNLPFKSTLKVILKYCLLTMLENIDWDKLPLRKKTEGANRNHGWYSLETNTFYFLEVKK